MMQRRRFLKTTGAAVSIPLLLNGIRLSAMPRTSIFNAVDDANDRVLVLIQLSGGNDGLNMVLPTDQYDGLAAVRSNILIPQNAILPLTDATGINPSMTSVKNMYDNGRLAVIQAVGYPDQNRSHFRSTDIWTSGSPANQVWRTGWMGRYFDSQYPDYPEGYPNTEHPHPFAITMGNLVSETCQGIATNFSLTLEDPFALGQLPEGQIGPVPNTPYGRELDFLRTAIAQTNQYATAITEVATAGNTLANYPVNRLAEQLQHVARLISGGLQTKIYVVNLGGFDTHANQVNPDNPTQGTHVELLRTLSDAMAAFQEDLRLLGIEQRVISITFSEFGRRIRSNAAVGTDHGTAAPLLMFGSCVQPQVLGDNPEISANVSVDEGVPMQHDFRDVYGSVLMDWFDVPEEDVRTFLYDGFTRLPIVAPCAVNAVEDTLDVPEPDMSVFPNPMGQSTTIAFKSLSTGRVRLSVFDAMGNELKVLLDQRLSSGEHTLNWDASGLPAGVYFCRLVLDGRQQVRRVVKG
ncbi:MAG TPA: DUF1501 domain-containing protein [Saprospiraceae bacterium]|nr:DUF1501 domain-containing protein [Saprospiraceae bacterium]HRK79876.1 DUF1501 domain-containing protein [Saprospiraceae bacterium]